MSDFENKCFGNSDLPIKGGAEDSFSTEAYIEGLCAYIRNCDTPMTISIQGSGGSGRTSMLEMMAEKLLNASDGEKKISVFSINAWQSSRFNVGLTFSVISLLIKELNEGGQHFRNIMNLFSSIGEKPRKAEEACAVADAIRELKNEFQAAVDEKLRSTGSDRIAFFIDDLDRLQPIKAVDLLEYLKMFIDCQRCVFVLAVNSDTIAEGVRQKYGMDDGGEFFDKMIQLPFNIPVEKYDIYKFVRTEFDAWDENILKKNDINLFKSLIANSIGFNPRGMKRLFNTFRLLDATIDIETKNAEKAAAERGEKQTDDKSISKISRQRALFAVICLQTCFEKLYWFLLSSSSLLDANSLTVFMNDEELRGNAEIMKLVFTDEEGKVDDTLIRRVRKFIPHFRRAVRAEYYDNVSSDEILRTVIREATVTSVGNMIMSSDEDKQLENRNLVDFINTELKSHYKGSVYFQPYYENDTTEACGYSAFKAYAGFEFSVVYSIRHTIKNTRVVKFMVKNLTKAPANAPVEEDIWKFCKNDVMFDTLGNDPINLGRKAESSFSGRKLSMDYDYVGEFAVNDSDGIKNIIIDVMKRAIETVKVHEQPTIS